MEGEDMEKEACNAECTKSVRCHLLKIENGACGNSCFESTESSEGSSTAIESATSSESKPMLDDDNVDDHDDDVVSSAFSLSSLSSEGPLFVLSDLASELPIKRGLSRFYQGKSQSFTSLSKVRSIDDLAKKVTPFKRRPQKPPNEKRTCMTKKAARATSTFLTGKGGSFSAPSTI